MGCLNMTQSFLLRQHNKSVELINNIQRDCNNMNEFKKEIKKSLNLDVIDTYKITNFSNVYKKIGNNDFSILKPLEKFYGIYIFRQKDNKDIL